MKKTSIFVLIALATLASGINKAHAQISVFFDSTNLVSVSPMKMQVFYRVTFGTASEHTNDLHYFTSDDDGVISNSNACYYQASGDETQYEPIVDLVAGKNYKFVVYGHYDDTFEVPPFQIFTIIETEATGIQTVAKENGFSLFPNPSTDRFTVVDPAWNENDKYVLCNMVGQQFVLNPTSMKTTFFTDMYPNGIYLLKTGSHCVRVLIQH